MMLPAGVKRFDATFRLSGLEASSIRAIRVSVLPVDVQSITGCFCVAQALFPVPSGSSGISGFAGSELVAVFGCAKIDTADEAGVVEVGYMNIGVDGVALSESSVDATVHVTVPLVVNSITATPMDHESFAVVTELLTP